MGQSVKSCPDRIAQFRNFRACLRSFRYRRSRYFLCLCCFLYCRIGYLYCLRNGLRSNLGSFLGPLLRLYRRVGCDFCGDFYSFAAFFLRLLVLYLAHGCRRSCCRCRCRLLLARTHY